MVDNVVAHIAAGRVKTTNYRQYCKSVGVGEPGGPRPKIWVNSRNAISSTNNWPIYLIFQRRVKLELTAVYCDVSGLFSRHDH